MLGRQRRGCGRSSEVNRVATYLVQGAISVVLVVLSPFLVIRSETAPLTPRSPSWDTVTNYHSGFPLPFMHRTNLGQRVDIDWRLFATDVVLLGLVIFGLSALRRTLRRRREGVPRP